MGNAETFIIVAIFLAWTAVLATVTSIILTTEQNPSAKFAWTVLIWTVPLLGLAAWAYFRSRLES